MPKIQLKDVYQQNLNMLIGAGASSGLFPTLWLDLKDSENPKNEETIETLATKLSAPEFDSQRTLLFMYYFSKVIAPVKKFKAADLSIPHVCFKAPCIDCMQREVINNYETLIESLVLLLHEKDNFKRQCNMFTTNYDSCIPQVADKILSSGRLNFAVNDGTRGFFEKTLSARNFNTYLCQAGVFGTNITDIPQLNLINLHGSVHWTKEGEQIKVDYSQEPFTDLVPDTAKVKLASFEALLLDSSKNTDDIFSFKDTLSDKETSEFWEEYDKLPVVNPTKWKFHETVFEEHYYQMLRYLSYELEKPNSTLITFAFSFADEHIRNLIKRSLSNPKLTVYICCFNSKEKEQMESKFADFKNVQFIFFKDRNLTFTEFNSEIFNADILREEKE